ncbi:MAG: L,D-transpeptidase [Verrucomicrobiales bacterium]
MKPLHLLLTAVLALLLAACAGIHQPARPSSTHPDILKQQIFLDSQNFGPGVVDGRLGEFTRKAMTNYRRANALPAEWMHDTTATPSHTTYLITARDWEILGPNADEPEDQAKQSKMPYTTLLEFLSERFHTTQKFLRSLNPGLNINNAPPGTTITVPAVARPFDYHAYPSSYPAPSAATAKTRHVIVNLRAKLLTIHENDRLIASFPITPGSSEHPAPAGEWRIVGAVPFPWFRYDLGVLKRGERTEDFHNLPPGPNSPDGILWAGLNRPGIGIHGTPVPDTIGRAGSHGCIRLSNWDAATFRTLVGKNTAVTIR